ncbi:hypothetical protein JTB14_027920 [Gonioctena quinquepunctata]|nr:hypothetical protein JTB14_027920 [Gonioctena quinquepunctata]
MCIALHKDGHPSQIKPKKVASTRLLANRAEKQWKLEIKTSNRFHEINPNEAGENSVEKIEKTNETAGIHEKRPLPKSKKHAPYQTR